MIASKFGAIVLLPRLTSSVCTASSSALAHGCAAAVSTGAACDRLAGSAVRPATAPMMVKARMKHRKIASSAAVRPTRPPHRRLMPFMLFMLFMLVMLFMSPLQDGKIRVG